MITLNENILQNAARGVDSEFLKIFAEAEIFFPIPFAGKDLKDGPLFISAAVHVEMKTVDTKFGRVLLFYTSRYDLRLSNRFGGMPLIRVAEMVSRQADIDGILIHSDSDAWFVVDKRALQYALGESRGGLTRRSFNCR